jgi:hypothetical protein
MQEIEVKFSEAARFIRRAFPDAKSRRTVLVSFRNKVHVSDFWDGGSRTYTRFLDMRTGAVLSADDIPKGQRQVRGNPYGLPIADVELSPHIAVVEHTLYGATYKRFRIYFYAGLDDHSALESVRTCQCPTLPDTTIPALGMGEGA